MRSRVGARSSEHRQPESHAGYLNLSLNHQLLPRSYFHHLKPHLFERNWSWGGKRSQFILLFSGFKLAGRNRAKNWKLFVVRRPVLWNLAWTAIGLVYVRGVVTLASALRANICALRCRCSSARQYDLP